MARSSTAKTNSVSDQGNSDIKPKSATAAGRDKRARGILEREDWLNAARQMLIREGIAAVKIDRIARALGVTRGGFYWRFDNHEQLLKALLDDWRTTNSQAIFSALRAPAKPLERFRLLQQVWMDEKDFDPRYDGAVRDWARTSPKVARAVKLVDAERVEAFRELFLDAGYDAEEAEIRARIMYYHQVGYYALGIKESRAVRIRKAHIYSMVITGLAIDPAA